MKKNLHLDKEERDLLDSFEKGEWVSAGTTSEEMERYHSYARATLLRNPSINIRLDRQIMKNLHQHADAAGVSFLGLIEDVLRKFAEGQLVERQ